MLMMIKRSNRGKLSGSLGGKALPGMKRGARILRRSFGMAVVSVFAAIAVTLLGAVPALAVSLGAPAHSKTAVLDPKTGKIKVTLSVTGDTDTSESKSSANLIVALDTSGSMNEVVGTKVSYVEDDSWSLWSERYGLVRDQYVSLSRKWEGDLFNGKHIYYYTDNNGNHVEYSGQRYRKETTDVTRLDVAKSALTGLADQLISKSDSTVKISLETFAGYGNEPSRYYGAGEAGSFDNLVNGITATGGTNWADALAKANALAKKDTSTPTYIVFLSDGKPTYGMRNGSRYGNGSESQSDSYLASFVTDAVNAANDRPENVLGFYAIYTGQDAADSMNSFASRTKASPNNSAINGSDSTALSNAFSNIVQTINEGISYTNVKITDSNSDYVDYVLPSGAGTPTFTYKKGEAVWSDAPKATVENGQVVWDLGSRKLKKGVTYSVSFEVALKQEAYDEAALVTGEHKVPTNADAQLAYSTVVTTNGKDTTTSQDPIKITSPEVTVPTSTLHISKTWDKKGWDSVSVPSKLTVQIKQKQGDKEVVYKTVTLDADNEWASDVVVAAGPTGHTYSVVETDAPAGWATTKTPVSVTLKGLLSQRGDQVITNTIKTNKLTIKKSVSGNFGDTSKDFSFKLTDASGTAIANAKAAKEGTSDGVNLTSDGTFTLKNSQSLVVELPYGATYQVVENDPKGTNDTIDYTTSISVGDSGAATDANARKASSPEGGITKDTTITYTNKRDVTPDVGVDLGGSAPYVAVVGGIGIAGVIWMVLKRRTSQGI